MERIDLTLELKEQKMKLMTIGNVSKQSGIGVEAVRFYEKSGLIDEPPRNESGYRQYPASTIVRIRFIKRAKEFGFTLKEIKELLNLRLDLTTTCDDVRQMAEEKLQNVQAKIRSLQWIEKALGELIGACAVGGPDGECPILEALEPELAVRLRELLEGEGIPITLGVEYRKAWVENGRKHLSYISDGKEVIASGDEILLAAGKDPNTSGLALDIAGVETNGKGAVTVSEFMQTSQPHIYAAGDVVDLPLRLETTAAHEGTLAAQNALTGSEDGIDYDSVPYTVFTDPQLSVVGLTEDELMKREGICSCRTVSLEKIPKAIITGRTEGLVRIVINPKTRRIHGLHFLSNQSSELAAIGMTLIRNKNTIDDVIESMPVFPSMAESIKLAAISFTRDISAISCCV